MYGLIMLCEDCGTEIPRGRVEAIPGVKKCVSCAASRRRIFSELPGSATVQHTGGLHEKYLREEDIDLPG